MKKANTLLGVIGWLYILVGVILNIRMFYIRAYPTYTFFILIGVGILLLIVNEIVKKYFLSRIWQLLIGILPIVILFAWTEINRYSNLVEAEPHKTVPNKQSKFKAGDIIFQISKSSQSEAIQLATNSKYSHIGIIYEIDG